MDIWSIINQNVNPHLKMNVSYTIFLLSGVSLLMGCNDAKEKPAFDEVIVDGQAPENLWMKTTGDINDDGKTDMLVGGWKSGGLVAYLAPDWTKRVINDSVKISTNAEVCDVNSDKNPDIVAVVNQAIVWFAGPDWTIHHIDSVTGHDVEVHDFDGDGLLDVIARNQGAFGDKGGHTLFFYKQAPAGVWTRHEKEIADGEGLKMADINDDGEVNGADLAVLLTNWAG